MTAQLILPLLAAASAVMANPPTSTLASSHNAREDDAGGGPSIQWGECAFNTTMPMECAGLEVPLDYTDAEGKTLNLTLSKVAAVNEPFLGSILLNFGGPGYEAVETLGNLGDLLLNMTGGQHDLVAFDPRGTGKTIPFDCFGSPEARALALAEYPLVLGDATDVALGDLWANTNVLASICGESRADIGELVGTAFVARDMMQIVDALDEDGLLRFWGLSYGSALGATAAAMFPDRMDRVVLDGVVNIQRYYDGFMLDADQLIGADAAWRAFLEECIAAGDKCGISHHNSTAIELETTLALAAESYRTDPIAVDGMVLDYELVFNLYYITIKSLGDLTKATGILDALVRRENLTEVAAYFQTSMDAATMANEASYGIKCGDATPRAARREEVMYDVAYGQQTSRAFGSLMPAQGMICAQWPFEAKGRYSGDFGVETPNPILFIGNTYDAATPAASAYRVSELFPGSVVVEQKGFGHASIAQPSECTFKTIRKYFVDGITPDANLECEVDVPLFA